MAVDKKNKDFIEEFAISEKRHRELILTIKGIVNEMPKTEIDLSSLETVKDSINKLISTQKFANTTPDNKVELLDSIKNLSANFVESMVELRAAVELSNRPKEYVFHVERDNEDNKITKVIAKTK